MASWAVESFGVELETKDGTKDVASVLDGKKLIGIYFSAHWCPPCRAFTPVLAEFYDQLKEDEGNGNTLEIVFVSSDNSKDEFLDYYGHMPWTSVPFERKPLLQALGAKYGVRGIPTFIIVDQGGNVVDRDGRATVSNAKGDVRKALAVWHV